MRKIVALVAGLAVLVIVNFGIYQREQLLTHGRIVFLELAPVDPRSLMQGDYMRLDFAVADQAFPPNRRKTLADGSIVVALDAHGVGRFRRLSDGGPLKPDEIALRYRVRGGQPNFATNAYFFEEGQARTYERAAYGEFRVGPDGDMILTGLRDARFVALRAKG
ncbi:GDYXXLXY domain-containing protein [Sphingomonas koreensis]